MGVVYRAHDPRLDRDVAIKVLSPDILAEPDARRRFRKEALALSKLSHPGIAVVHDFNTEGDVDFLVMELVPGVTLDHRLAAGPLPETTVAELGLQLAEALAAAHSQGIIHRDLKPGNLRLTPEGRLKILDFGLAKTLHVSTDAVTETVVDPGAMAGTLPYMAPEQLRDGSVDQRSDIWAAGAVLYEMATGRRPFAAPTPAALAGEILHAPVTPLAALRPNFPEPLERIIVRCLSKDPDARYQSAGELAADLRAALAPSAAATSPGAAATKRTPWLVAAAVIILGVIGALGWYVRGRPADANPGFARTLIVLPLENVSKNADEQYLADGLTDALITELAGAGPLRVLARGSVIRAQAQGKPPATIARELNADAYLEGTIQRAGERVRISTRLVDVATSSHLWGRNYERDLKDILSLQTEIASAIVAEMVPAASKRQAPGRRQVDPAAHEAYLRGRFFWNKREVDAIQKAIDYFEEAIAKDPGFAAAHSGIADSYVSLYDYGFLSAADVGPKIRAAARRALELDPRSAEGHASLAHLALHDWDWAEAERQFREAITLDPSYITAHHWYALCLTAMGKTGDAVVTMERAQQLDPLSLRINADLGMALLAAGRYDSAIEQERKTLELQPGFRVAIWIQGMAYQQKGQLPQAIQKYQEALALAPDNPNFLAALGNVFGEAGRVAEARRILAQLEKAHQSEEVSAFFFALVHAGLGEKAAALDWLEKAYRERSGSIRYLKVEPRLNRLRSEPRFQDLMKRVGLADQQP